MTDTKREAHTPLPWKQSHRRKRTGMYSTQVYCADGETIAEIDWYPRPAGNGAVSTYREANAAFIARACNSHYLLTEALREAVAQYGKQGGPWNVPSDPGGWLDRARAALSQAGGHNAD